jgi:hypothetical protein
MENSNRESGFMCRLVRFALWGTAALLFFAVLLVATLPLWISPIATGIAGKVVPGYTGTDFRIDRFCLNPYSGSLVISGVKLSNPEGFGDAAAFSLSGFNVEVSVESLFSDTILMREVAIEDAFVSYYSNDGKNNFDVILANVEKAKGPKNEKAVPDEKKKESASSKKKVIIEHLRVAGTKVKLMKSDMMPPLMLPTIELTDIGRKSGGATLEEAWSQIVNSVMKSMSSAGDGLGALGMILGEGAKNASGSLDAGMKDLSSLFDGFSGGSTSSKKKKSERKSSGMAEKTVEAVGDTAKSAVDIVDKTAKGTIDAVGDTTKKAAEGVKNLFKGFDK